MNTENAYKFMEGIIKDLKEEFISNHKDIDYFTDFLYEFVDSYFFYYDDELNLKIINRYQDNNSESNNYMSEKISKDELFNLSAVLLTGAYQVTIEELYHRDMINKLQDWDGATDEEKEELLKELKEDLKQYDPGAEEWSVQNVTEKFLVSTQGTNHIIAWVVFFIVLIVIG